ncbi:MAG: 7-cyano-7-deazaguanine synthase QueC [Rhodospirillales bacterium]|jgi:7-cyano-7-deazaguanine synthase|nr:7-cyano-7-deazaguanine synthase QueC [Rhodospirillales bacterium]MBT5077054.1 7-cyano-7-deazaguanine synthase QueC [Rhodospirillales bacterium]MBT5113055.1 7-cyano-7-deazaguanine synthase QueC [Rhodospirillales bacterium]MBT5672931.1 7-cyano-7-deazaguanine synthase QueC [Rhodospirillales bacterium]MBT6187608.1 7-cyano-7-deazaguanine synthase QueC [Rhodospirillales bacterium]
MAKNAILLLSGGLDSTTLTAMAQAQGFNICALTIDYGQRHNIEIEAARTVARTFDVARHVVLPIDLRAFGGSALTDNIPVPKGRTNDEIEGAIPITYVPARNTIFLSLALGWAETMDSGDLFIGVNARDYSGYPDCRGEFIQAYETMANLATQGAVEGRLPVKIHTPLIDMTKGEIIRAGTALGVDYGQTRSCYDPDDAGRACGECDSCQLRLKGFSEAGLADPTPYQDRN